MNTHKIVVKLFLAPGTAVDRAALVPVLHQWIRDRAMEDHLMVDVANYAHVFQGPGTVLVMHEANLHLDDEDGRSGLSYWRKQPFEGLGFAEALEQSTRITLAAAARLEGDLPSLRFDGGALSLRINDRLHGPNADQTLAAVRPTALALAQRLYGAEATVDRIDTPRQLFELRLTGPSVSVAELLERIAPARV